MIEKVTIKTCDECKTQKHVSEQVYGGMDTWFYVKYPPGSSLCSESRECEFCSAGCMINFFFKKYPHVEIESQVLK